MNRLTAGAIAAGCGVLGGGLYLAVLLGSGAGLILVYLTQLPLFVAGLWLGTSGAAIAGLTATLVLLTASDLLGAVLFAALNVVPVVILVRQALLARRGEDGQAVWYPPGLLTAWLTALALAGIVAAVVLLGGSGGVQAQLREMIVTVLDRLGDNAIPDRAEVASAVALVIPGIIAASWVTMVAINGVLAQGLVTRFGVNWRPSPELVQLALPMWLPLALIAAIAGSIFGEPFRFVGINAMILLLVPFALAGLAVLHAAVRHLSHPLAALIGFYVLAGMFGWPLLAIAILGLFETWLGLRGRLLAPGGRNG
jgi:hypothetical protein